MRKLLTRALVTVALAGAGAVAYAQEGGIPYYVRGPRIIHVPQPGEDVQDSRASLRSDTSGGVDDDEAAYVAPPPRRAMKPAPKPRPKTLAKASTHQEPLRRKPYNVSLPEPPPPPPEPSGPRRALLSAPPPTSSLSDGPTPIRPTPRFAAPLPEPVSSAPSPDPVTAAMPAPEPADNSDDHLPPPGDPRLAPPEPSQ